MNIYKKVFISFPSLKGQVSEVSLFFFFCIHTIFLEFIILKRQFVLKFQSVSQSLIFEHFFVYGSLKAYQKEGLNQNPFPSCFPLCWLVSLLFLYFLALSEALRCSSRTFKLSLNIQASEWNLPLVEDTWREVSYQCKEVL